MSEDVKWRSESLSVFLCFYFCYYVIRKEFGRTIFTIGLQQRIKETARIPAFDEVTGREAMKASATLSNISSLLLHPPKGDKVFIEPDGIPSKSCIQSG